jgi:hypothetical protein
MAIHENNLVNDEGDATSKAKVTSNVKQDLADKKRAKKTAETTDK